MAATMNSQGMYQYFRRCQVTLISEGGFFCTVFFTYSRSESDRRLLV